MTTSPHTAEHLFHGALAEDYEMLKLICPAAAEMSQRVADFVSHWRPAYPLDQAHLLEIGCGTGITTRHLLACPNVVKIVSLDNAPAMLSQARRNLSSSLAEGRLQMIEIDALSFLQALPEASFDIVASAYTLHNFLTGYREQVLEQIWRVLKPGGLFINGDRYAVDDVDQHLKITQEEVKGYFRVFLTLNRPDLLEQWVVHLFSDESEHHIMRLQAALDFMASSGFQDIKLHFRDGVNALISAVKC